MENNETEEVRPDLEDEGGPVKSFLEHLEDLRWVLIKSAAAVGVGMVVCLIAANTLVEILKWPLYRAAASNPEANSRSVAFLLGTNVVGRFHLKTNELESIGLGTNHIVLQLTTVQIGTNRLVALQPVTGSDVGVNPNSLVQLINLGPAGGFVVAFQIAFYGGLALVSPFVLYFLGQFILPALKRNERRYVIRGLGIGAVLFFTGVLFCYFLLLPMVLGLSVKYSEWLGFSAFQWKAEEYISFVCKFMIGMGLGFELPVVVLILVRLGIVTATQLAKFRPYMIVINLVLGAVLTTPEIITQLTMFVPLQLLYEISILIARYWERQDKKREAEAAQLTDDHG
jgi:sec-independent protein translocase protein TatC